MELGELLYRIGADATDFIKTVEDMDKRMKKLEKAMKEHLKFDDFGSGITEGAGKVKDAFGEVSDSAQEAGDSFEGMGDSAQEAGDSVGGALDGGQNAAQKFVQALIQAIPPFDELKNKAVDFAKAVDVAFSKAAESAGTLTQKLGSGLTGVGQKLTNYVTKPAIGATTALLGMAAWGGLRGLESLDQAQARLRGLGYEGKELSSIMGQVSEAVKGTTFWTHDMADVAAKALQGGAKVGKELESRLNAVSAATAASNAELSHMGQILNRVGSAGKATLGDLTQLEDNGVAAAQVLADEFGKTAEEIRKMASAGEITAEMLEQALGNQLGGVAMEMATTFGEVFQIMQGQVSRLGQAFWTAGQTMDGSFNTQAGAFAKLKDLMNEIYEDLTKLEEVAGRWGAKFETAIDGVIGAYKGLKKWVSGASKDQLRMAKGIGAVAIAAGPLLMAFGKILTVSGGLAAKIATVTAGFNILGMGALGAVGSFGVLAGAVGLIGGALGLLPDTMKDAITAMNTAAQRALPQVFETIKNEITEKLPQAIHEGLSMMADTFNTLEVAVDGLGEIARSIIQSITEAFQEDDGQWVGAAVSLITSLGRAIVGAAGDLLVLGAEIVSQIGQSVSNNTEQIREGASAIVAWLVDYFKGDGVKDLITLGVDIVAAVAEGIIENKEGIWEAALELLEHFGKALGENAGTVLKVVGTIVVVALAKSLIMAGLSALWAAGITLLKTLAASILGGPGLLIAAGVALIGFLIWGIVKNWDTIKEKGRELVGKIKEGWDSAVEGVKEWGSSIIDRIKGAFSERGEEVREEGRQTSENLKGGLEEGAEGVEESAEGFMARILGSMDKRVEAAEKGRGVGEGLQEGLDEVKPEVDITAHGLGSGLLTSMDSGLGDMLGFGRGIGNKLTTGLGESHPLLWEGGYDATSNVATGASEGGDLLDGAGQELGDGFRATIAVQAQMMNQAGKLFAEFLRIGMVSGVSDIRSGAEELAQEVLTVLEEKMPTMRTKGKALASNIKSGFASVSLHGAGRNIMAGLESGLRAGFESVMSFMRGAMARLQNIVTRMNAIRSPSRVYKRFGGFMMDGLGLGLRDGFGAVKETMEDSMKELQEVTEGADLGDLKATASLASDGVEHLHSMQTLDDVRAREEYTMKLQEETNDLLQEILKKDTTIYMDKEKVGETVRPIINSLNHREDELRNRRRGVRLV